MKSQGLSDGALDDVTTTNWKRGSNRSQVQPLISVQRSAVLGTGKLLNLKASRSL